MRIESSDVSSIVCYQANQSFKISLVDLPTSLSLAVIRVYGTAELEENLSRNTEFYQFLGGTTEFFIPTGRGFLSKMIRGMRNFHEILWICGFLICCLAKKGRGHISIFPVSTMRIFFKPFTRILTATLLLFPPRWMENV